jgi:hypothetical protein
MMLVEDEHESPILALLDDDLLSQVQNFLPPPLPSIPKIKSFLNTTHGPRPHNDAALQHRLRL